MRNIAGPLIKATIFVLVTGLATAILAVSISNTGLGDTATYYARFTDVTSLNPGDDVRVSGVRVGQVESLSIVDKGLARVGFSVDRHRSLPPGVSAVIKYRNMVGQRYIALDRGTGPATPALPEGSEIPVERTTPALDLTDLFNGFKPLFQALSAKDVNQLSGEIVQVLQGEGGTVESLLAHTGSLTATLASRDKVIGEVITNLNSVLKTINGQGDALSTLVSTLQRLVTGLAGDRAAIGDAIDGIAELSTATAGLLDVARPGLRDTIAGLDELSANLATGSDELDQFLTLSRWRRSRGRRSRRFGLFGRSRWWTGLCRNASSLYISRRAFSRAVAGSTAPPAKPLPSGEVSCAHSKWVVDPSGAARAASRSWVAKVLGTSFPEQRGEVQARNGGGVPHRERVHLGDIRPFGPHDAMSAYAAIVEDHDLRARRTGQQAGKLPSTARLSIHGQPQMA